MSMPTTSVAIKTFLDNLPINYAEDLTTQYEIGMEVQVMCDPTDGEAVYEDDKLIRNTWQICDEDYGTYSYHHIRIPKKAMSEPYWNDTAIRFPIQRHVECIGMTGWNWKLLKSKWVAFDFDSIVGHAQGVGVSDEALDAVREAACKIPWVQVRKSTGGSGIHLYVFFDPTALPECENHTVHAGLARCILGLMEREAGFDFRGNMDVLGGNMWVWRRNIDDINKGLKVLKDYEIYCPPLPENWKDNVQVVTGGSSKVVLHGIADCDQDAFEAQAAAKNKVPLDDVHTLMETRIHELGYSIVWVSDHWCWQTHCKAFKDLLEKYPEEYKGLFDTLSQGDDPGKPNCFVHPVKGGQVRINKFGRGAKEHDTWNQDGIDWTWTTFNKPPTLDEAANHFEGCEDSENKGWVFTEIENVENVVEMLGGELNLDPSWRDIFGGVPDRNITLKPNKTNQLVIEIAKKKEDQTPKGWISKGRKFTKLFKTIAPHEKVEIIDQIENYDESFRAVANTSGDFESWYIRNNQGTWIRNNKDNLRSQLKLIPDPGIDGETLIGGFLMNNWTSVCIPFQPTYLGNRKWNRGAPQLAVQPAEHGTPHPHWDMVLEHCGQDLTSNIENNQWCKEAGIRDGADYLSMWLSLLLRDPYCKLPYLFMFGPQNSGKSMFHEAAALLMTRGVQIANESLTNSGNFNGELDGAVLCVVEEVDLSGSGSSAYNRMKAWVTGQDILIHAKKIQAVSVKNCSHWVHCANHKAYCPVFPGDTRITMMHVPMLSKAEIPKDVLLGHLKREAGAYLRSLLNLRLAPPPGRLRLPIIITASKREAEDFSRDPIQRCLEDDCYPISGSVLKLKDFYEHLRAGLTQEEKGTWTYNKVASMVGSYPNVIYGRGMNNTCMFGNMSLEPKQQNVEYGLPWEQVGVKVIRITPAPREEI